MIPAISALARPLTVFADGVVESFYVDVLAAEMDVCGEDFSDADKALAFTLVAAFKGNAAKAEGEVDVEITNGSEPEQLVNRSQAGRRAPRDGW